MLEYDEDGELDKSTMIPLIDGGTEGSGSALCLLCGLIVPQASKATLGSSSQALVHVLSAPWTCIHHR